MYHGLSLSRRHSMATRNVGTRGGFLYLHGLAAQNHLPLRPLVPRQEFGALSVWVAEGPGGHVTLGSQASCVGHFESGRGGRWERQCAVPR